MKSNLKKNEHIFRLILTQFNSELLRLIVEKMDRRYQLRITRVVRTCINDTQTSCILFENCLLIDQVLQHPSIISSKSSVNLFIDTRSIIDKMTRIFKMTAL